jgi:hypothetical protein
MLPGSLPDQRTPRAVARRAGAGRPPEAAARPERGRARRSRLDSKNGSTRQRDAGLVGGRGLGEDTCLSGVWRHVPGGPNREYGKSQMAKIGTLTCSFLVAAHSKTDQRHLRRSRGSEPRPLHNSRRRAQKDGSRAKQRANGVRLQATPADGLRQSPQVNGSSGDTGRRRNTQKIWFASRRPGVRVPLAPQARGSLRS